MTTPNSHFRPQLPVILVLLLAAAAEEQQPMARPGCRDKCGNMSIPFPFGIGRGCFRDGFEVMCNDSSETPRALQFQGKGKYQSSWSPLKLVSMSVAAGEARVYAPVSYSCSTNSTATFSMTTYMDFSGTPFHVSATSNVLIGVGLKAEPLLTYSYPPVKLFNRPLSLGWVKKFSCRSEGFAPWENTAVNGSCTGRGCCEATLAPLLRNLSLSVKGEDFWWETYPCSYGMLVEKSWYNFSTPDMYGYKTLLKRFPRGVPLVLNFIAGNGSCPAEGQLPPLGLDYACVSGNSSCANVAHGYICKCWDHYDGNPYVTHGCQDIDECKLQEVYPCSSHGICKNRLGGYDCPCIFGMKGDGKAGTCTDVFTPAAKAIVGAISGILLMTVLFLVILHKEKRKTKEFFRKNGGPTLEKANVIKLFKKEELKPILKNKNLIGKGGFGEVYKGLLDNKLVAIKKPINGSVLQNEQFANEVIIQSQVIHKNIVKLIGCC